MCRKRFESVLIAVVLFWPLSAGAFQKVRPQVEIQARFVEIDRSVAKDLGISMTLGQSTGSTLKSKVFFPADVAKSLSSVIPPQNAAGCGDLSAILKALQDRGRAKILDQPRLTAADGREAAVTARKDIPFAVPAGETTMKNFGFGTKIDVKPIASKDGRISMQLAVKAQGDSIDLGTVPPSRLTREASTAITMSEGQTFLINGLIDDRFRNAASRVPALGDLPIVGSLFQSQRYRSGASELVLFVTPQIVSEGGRSGSEAKTETAGSTAGPNRKFTLSGCFGYGLYGGGDFNAAMAGSNDFLAKYSPGHTGQYDTFKSGFSGSIEAVYWWNKNMGVGLGIDWYRSGFSGDRIEFQEGTAKSIFTNDASVNVVPVEVNFHYQRDICQDMFLDFFFGPGLYFGCFDFNEAYDYGTNDFTGTYISRQDDRPWNSGRSQYRRADHQGQALVVRRRRSPDHESRRIEGCLDQQGAKPDRVVQRERQQL